MVSSCLIVLAGFIGEIAIIRLLLLGPLLPCWCGEFEGEDEHNRLVAYTHDWQGLMQVIICGVQIALRSGS